MYLHGVYNPYRSKYDNIGTLQDINNNRPIREALAYEEQFFRDYHVHLCYFSFFFNLFFGKFFTLLHGSWHLFEGIPWFI